MTASDLYALFSMGCVLALLPIVVFLLVTDGAPPRKRRKARKSRR